MRLRAEIGTTVLLLGCLISVSTLSAQQVDCPVQKPSMDPAAVAFRQGDFSKAFELYFSAARNNPQDLQAIAGQVRSLLQEGQISEASQLAESNLATNPASAKLLTAMGEIRLRQGRLTEAAEAYQTSLRFDPCLARTRYDWYQLLWIESMRATGYQQLKAAYKLDPDDPDIHLSWIERLPLSERIQQIDDYLEKTADIPADQQRSLKEYVSQLRAAIAAKNGGCRLASHSVTETSLPLEGLATDVYHRTNGMGFEISVNQKANAELELDTGLSGILLNHDTAEKAGLVPVTSDTISGLGDQKSMSGYWAYADDLRIGSLEFKDCLVEVSDTPSIVGKDGLIGADVFENYHVKLDFPAHQMTLSQLPPIPGEHANHGASLNASGVGNATPDPSSPDVMHEPTTPAPEIHYVDRYIGPEMQLWSPFARVGHQIFINGELKDKKPRLFLLDSGSSVSILSIPAAESAGSVHSDTQDSLTGLSGRVANLYTEGGVDLDFARLRAPLKDVLVINMDGLSTEAGVEVSGIIGLQTLRYLTVDIDYRDGLIHVVYDPNDGANAQEGLAN
ncbi:MAG TPA: aspartyl protease family protein [Acidobacteriaceae bacterium]|nr:aspartyl protease family protein [Acidobacteriaceae bacterium]